MKLIILVACALVAVAAAASPEYVPDQIVRSSFEQTPQGGYNFGYETEKGSVREETGELREAFDEDKKPHVIVAVRGTYSYVDPEGHVQSVAYKADENGYEAVGDSIPQAPARR